MAYIGKTPVVGNFQVCDAISVVNGQAAYTLQVGSANVIPESANHMIVSLNGVIQKPCSSFTVAGSTITVASNLVTGDAIDFVQILGNVLDIGTPSDATVTTAKLGGALITPSTLDVNGNELILDADADTSITADTDDQIDFKTGGTDRLTIRNDGVGIGVTSASAPLEVRTNLSSDTQSTPETVLTLATKFASTSSNGVAGSGSRLEFQIPDDETNPITGAAIAGLKENGDDSSAEAALAFYISQNDTTLDEAMRIKSNGALQAKLNGASAETWTPAADSHQLIGTDNNDVVVAIKADTSSYASNVIRALCNRSGNSGYSFLTCTSGNLADDQFILRGEGNAYADGSWNGGGADYAEYFEWHDGNTSNEDRRGYTVVLDGNKIRKSTNEDNTNNIIGVISGNPSVVGDNDIGRWKNKYQKDDYGSHILDENGDRILNTEYDENQNYISREDRQEWDIVGLMGKVRINKGQPVGDRWIKMRDISETVEEWLIR